jgi:SAM-dependent methyltransferase
MYNKDYDIENNQESVQRKRYDDTLYVVSQFLQQFHNKEKPILDLGSGDCHYHAYFEDYSFVGLDKNKIHKGKPTDKLIDQNIEEFPYNIPNEDTPFDFVISLDTFEHLIRPDKVLDYLKQDDHILRKGGYIFLSVPNINTLDDKLLGINTAVYDPKIKKITNGR